MSPGRARLGRLVAAGAGRRRWPPRLLLVERLLVGEVGSPTALVRALQRPRRPVGRPGRVGARADGPARRGVRRLPPARAGAAVARRGARADGPARSADHVRVRPGRRSGAWSTCSSAAHCSSRSTLAAPRHPRPAIGPAVPARRWPPRRRAADPVGPVISDVTWPHPASGRPGSACQWTRRSRSKRGPPPAGQRRHCRPGWGVGRPRQHRCRPRRTTGRPRRPGRARRALHGRGGRHAVGHRRRPPGAGGAVGGDHPPILATGLPGEPTRHRRRPRPDPSRDAPGRGPVPLGTGMSEVRDAPPCAAPARMREPFRGPASSAVHR